MRRGLDLGLVLEGPGLALSGEGQRPGGLGLGGGWSWGSPGAEFSTGGLSEEGGLRGGGQAWGAQVEQRGRCGNTQQQAGLMSDDPLPRPMLAQWVPTGVGSQVLGTCQEWSLPRAGWLRKEQSEYGPTL